MKQIFLISGHAQAGKDSTANFLKLKLDGEVLVLHFADYLKYIAKTYMNWDGNKDDKGRSLLQWLGTDKIRVELNKPLFWVEKVCDIIEILQEKYDYFCVADCRFPNEIYYPKSRFPNWVSSIYIERLHFDNGLTEEQKKHPSETALENFTFDYTIYSESGLDKLELKVNNFIKQYNFRTEP